jgi:hypothetical protein
MARLPRPPILIFVFLVAHVHVVPSCYAAPLPPTYNSSMCSESSRCGGVEIRYPFYLANATGWTIDHTTTYSCGYTDLRIFCQQDDRGGAGNATIQFGQYNYTVKDISYNNNTILLADADAFRGGDNSCPIIRHNVTFDHEWLNYTESFNNLTFFFSCNSGDTLLPPGLGDYRIGCPEFSGVTDFVFSSDELEASREYDLADHCHEIIIVPVRNDSLAQMNKNNRSLLRGGYGTLVRDGFELAWSEATTGDCYLCEGSGGRCAYSRQNKVSLGCLCTDGKVGMPDCRRLLPTQSSKSLSNRSLQLALAGLHFTFDICIP